MRIVKIAALFTMLFIARVRCRPDGNLDYISDQEDYNQEDDISDAEEPTAQETNSPPPHIHTSPIKLLVRLGQDVQLPCNATNTQSVAVTWRKGKTPLFYDNIRADAVDPRIGRRSDNSLMIHNFMNSDVSDEYICEISSEPPERVVHSVRNSRHLFVLPSDKVEVTQPNETVKLACKANWEPKPKIEWFLEGKKVPSDHHPADGSSLTIHNVSEKTSGRYQCLVETTPSDTKLYPIHVFVHHAPKIELESERVHSGLHLESELSCEVDAYPQADVTWFKDGKIVAKGRNTKTELSDQKTKHTLVISRTEKSDFGKYTCQASNSLGKSSRLIELTGAPRDPKFIGVDATPDSKIVTMKWQVESFSPIIKYELKYRRKGETNWQFASPRASDDGTGNVFEVKHGLEGLKAGNYEAVLTAQNEFGWSPEPNQPHEFDGAGSKSGAASVQSLIISRSLLTAVSLLVCNAYL